MEKLTLQKIKVYKKVCGIYKIKIHDKEYIGSSKNIQHRLRQHLITLKQNKHHNHTMQNLYNKYGIDNIYFEVIETCLEENRISREKYYINSIKPGGKMVNINQLLIFFAITRPLRVTC